MTMKLKIILQFRHEWPLHLTVLPIVQRTYRLGHNKKKAQRNPNYLDCKIGECFVFNSAAYREAS